MNPALTITSRFKFVTWFTFIVYFITALCGHINFFIANFWGKTYFPLRSYLLTFDNSQIKNPKQIAENLYNLSGFKAVITTPVPYKIIDDIFFTLMVTALVILFFVGYKIVQSEKINHTEIIKWSIVFSLLMTIAIPSHSSDLFGYMARGAQQSLYHQNPYLITVSEIKGYSSKPLFVNFMWPLHPATYGPVFIYLTKLIVSLSNNDFFLSFINFKLLNLTLFLILIFFVLKTNNTKDIYLISWNPLILIHGLWNCHNDLLSGLLIFLGLYLIKNKSYFWSAFCLALAAGVKFVSLIILPVIFVYFFKKKHPRGAFLNLVLGICSGIILIFIFSIDYLIPNQHITSVNINRIIENIGLVHRSFISTIFATTKYFCYWQKIDCNHALVLTILKFFFYLTFSFFCIAMLLKRKQNLIYDVVLILLVFFSFTIAKFHSWYLLNFIILIPLLEEGILKNILITLSMTHSYAITFINQANILNFISMTLLPTLITIFKGKKK